MIERHAITSREQWLALRQQDITASVAAALVDKHPRVTPYELWAIKTGVLTENGEPNDAMMRGLLLEGPVVEVLKRERPTWRVTRAHQYFRDPEIRLGATPDAYAECPERGRGLIQVKTVESSAFRDQWKRGGEVEPPLWIAIQAIVEAHLTERKWCAVAVLEVGWGAKLHVLDVPLHAGLIERIRAETVAFWRGIEEGHTPPPDFARDADVIRSAWRFDHFADLDEEIDLTGDNALPALLAEREALSAAKIAAEKRVKEINGELLFKLAGHGCARCADGRLVTAKVVERKGYSVPPSSYVDLRVRNPSPKGMAA